MEQFLVYSDRELQFRQHLFFCHRVLSHRYNRKLESTTPIHGRTPVVPIVMCRKKQYVGAPLKFDLHYLLLFDGIILTILAVFSRKIFQELCDMFAYENNFP